MAANNKISAGITMLLCLLPAACTEPTQQPDPYEQVIEQALASVNLAQENISLPKVPDSISRAARLPLVDTSLANPPGLISLGREIKDIELRDSGSGYIAEVWALLEAGDINPGQREKITAEDTQSAWDAIISELGADGTSRPPLEWYSDESAYAALRRISAEIARATTGWKNYGGQPTEDELELMYPRISSLQNPDWATNGSYDITPDIFSQVGERVSISGLTGSLLGLLAVIEANLPHLARATPLDKPLDWETPYGLVRIAGQNSDAHEGTFLLLIDLGGDDTYTNVVPSKIPGNVLAVIDLEGNDKVNWHGTAGPGSGILGIGIWLDLDGNDSYAGDNLGLGAGLFGSGLFRDEHGDDVYTAGALVQGTGQYGTGIYIDRQGNDHSSSSIYAQGYGGPGGIGILVDYSGNDRYTCGGKVPDPVEARNARHSGKHYLSLCQGYSNGKRPEVSGGIGLLLDKSGNDVYEADIFSQGGAYWFGLGMLVDSSGNDSYSAYEHAQGESLHLAAGFLGDWAGDDKYTGHEHVQGTGIDRSAGILYDDMGDDVYKSSFESQGTGIKAFGVGILLDNAGDDTYIASRASQGNAVPWKGAPDNEWPVGILLDLGGTDSFQQPYTEVPGNNKRIQNRQGIAIDKQAEQSIPDNGQ
ncbi:MAG TPA: hypothetical protein VET88_09655 [Gammaproteobacteria bacterium]|nr:hypothetical protein [Gammaproteobacteria bacterium]